MSAAAKYGIKEECLFYAKSAALERKETPFITDCYVLPPLIPPLF
jgi:hypothetical protein